ncbi:MAG: hypothetical protein ACXQTI_02725 [Candidatus Nezhaarchaeales archaeon]
MRVESYEEALILLLARRIDPPTFFLYKLYKEFFEEGDVSGGAVV